MLATNYMNKWMEAMTTSSIKAKDVLQFTYHNNCIRFGVLLEIILEWSIIYQASRRKKYYDKKTRNDFFPERYLELLYDKHLDNIKGQNMMTHWEGPFVVHD